MQVTKNVFLLDSTKGSFAYLVLAQEPVLIDTSFPGRADAIIADIEESGVRITDIAHILLTHHDVDHIGNARALQAASGAKLWAPKLDIPFITGQQKRPGVRRVVGALVKVDQPYIDATYTPVQRIAGIEVIPTPGHTPGHTSFLFDKVFFAGDLLNVSKGKLTEMPGALTWDKEELARSIAYAETLSYEWICPAHSEPAPSNNLRQQLRVPKGYSWLRHRS